ncbi:methyltransferase domain-containing protein [Thiohalophilus sp.]|uniref:methyltransferase domain-containing protein n=1 Tax=Thiohalophilus sp. TaxID=3028392 RepID=UPI002ACE6016|nr:methyltransferase domain-containing protein [Thiohalophilus sp.]MDZ7662106.1 methyltransferase domain-containing protein [Thiohalophilus sp.]
MSRDRDHNFDHFHQRFKQNIYASLKGRLRLAILWQDVQQHILPLAAGRPLRVLDAGSGMGNFSQRLHEQGHQLLLCDISGKQLEDARLNFSAAQASDSVRFVQQPFQQLADDSDQQFDLVLSHAVLEWLTDPQQGIGALQQLISPGGWLSLLFFNRHSLIYRHLLNGNFKRVRSGDLAGEGKYLTPDNPLIPEQVYDWLEDSGLQIVACSGVRTFTDFMDRGMRDKLPFEELLEMELRYSSQEPFRSLARYIHVICHKP